MNDNVALKSILLITANPKGTKSLRLHEEERDIKELLRRAGYGKVPIHSTPATRPRDIHQSMLDFEPQIVHFSGHGAGQDGLVFEDVTGQDQLVSSEALANCFKLFSNRVECVVLNACYSKFQAEAIAQHIDYVIGMSQAIGDRAAIEFAVGFYTALGAGKTIEFAYEIGCNAIQLADIAEHSTPVIHKKKSLAIVVISDVEPSFLKENLALSSDNEAKQQTENLRQRQEVKQHKKSSQIKENIPSSFSNKLRVARACLLSIFIAGELYFNSTPPQPQSIVEKSISISPTSPTKSSLPTQFVLAKAKAIAKRGDKGLAIKLAQSVNGAQASEAQSLISQWQPKWEKEQDAFEQVKRDYDNQLWQKVYDIKLDYSSIPNTLYWNQHEDLENMVKTAKKELDAIKKKALDDKRVEEKREAEAGINQDIVPDRPLPEQFVKDYYEKIRNGDTDTTWQWLTENYQLKELHGGFSRYKKFYSECEVRVEQVETIKQNNKSAKVKAQLLFYKRITKKESSELLQIFLVWDSANNNWQIDDTEKITKTMQGG